MEALHARQLFPCFDESEFKATFAFTVGRKETHNTLGNTAHEKKDETHPMQVCNICNFQMIRSDFLTKHILCF